MTLFRDKRNWKQYHSPRHLSSAIAIEAAELQEEMLWMGPKDVEEKLSSDEGREGVKDEIGDVLTCALLFCDRVGIDPLAAIAEKLEKNQEKYPRKKVTKEANLERDRPTGILTSVEPRPLEPSATHTCFCQALPSTHRTRQEGHNYCSSSGSLCS